MTRTISRWFSAERVRPGGLTIETGVTSPLGCANAKRTGTGNGPSFWEGERGCGGDAAHGDLYKEGELLRHR